MAEMRDKMCAADKIARFCQKCGAQLIHTWWPSYFDDRGEEIDNPEVLHTFTCPNIKSDATGHENYASYNMDVFYIQRKDER